MVGGDCGLRELAWLDLPRPAIDERHAHAAFIGRPCRRAQTQIARHLIQDQPAIVRREDDDRVLRDAQRIQFGAQPTTLSHAFHQRRVGRVVLGIPRLRLRLVSDHRWLAHQRRVDGEVRQVEKEGLRLVVLDEFLPLAGQPIGKEFAFPSMGKMVSISAGEKYDGGWPRSVPAMLTSNPRSVGPAGPRCHFPMLAVA